MSAALPVGRSAEESENCRGAAPETATVLVLAVAGCQPPFSRHHDFIIAQPPIRGRRAVAVRAGGCANRGHAPAAAMAESPPTLDKRAARNLGCNAMNRAVLPHMRAAKQGLLVWVSSSSSAGGTPPYLSPYFAAKAAMDALAVKYARAPTPAALPTRPGSQNMRQAPTRTLANRCRGPLPRSCRTMPIGAALPMLLSTSSTCRWASGQSDPLRPDAGRRRRRVHRPRPPARRNAAPGRPLRSTEAPGTWLNRKCSMAGRSPHHQAGAPGVRDAARVHPRGRRSGGHPYRPLGAQHRRPPGHCPRAYAISPTVREIYAFSWASLRELDEARFRDSFGLAASMSGGGRRTTGR